MRRLSVTLCGLVVVFAAASMVWALPTADEIMEKAAKAAEDVKTFQCDMKMSMSMGPAGMSATGTATGKRDTVDGKPVHKLHQTMKMRTPSPDGQTVEVRQKTVNDGKYQWEEMTHPMMGGTMVTKRRADAGDAGNMPGGGNPAMQFEEMKKTYDFKVVGTQTVDGVKCYVIEGTLKDDVADDDADDPTGGMMRAVMKSMKMYIGEKDMFPRRMTVGGEKPFMSMDFSNVKLNGKVDDALFKYTPPAGAQVNDETGD